MLVVEEILGECASQLRLANAGWPQEDKRSNRTIGIGETRARAQHRFGHGVYRLVLADDAPMKLIFEVQQLLLLAFHELRNRNAGPARDYSGDIVFVHLFFGEARSVLMRQALFFGRQLFLSCASVPYLSSATRLRSYCRSACSICVLASSIRSRISRT